ncbi:MAG: hypothetical protein IJZ65_03530 [Ruminiclostridium sp.]|nr:hypothetical protein [Ruminiclostridium sp.]
MNFLASLNEMSAGEGLPIVLLSGLQAFGALALIIAVLLIMDRVYKKKHPDWEKEIKEKSDTESDPEDSSEDKGDNQ